METFIKSLIEKTGITEEQAKASVQHVLDSIKSQLPDMLHEYIDQAANGVKLTDSLKGKVEDTAEDIKEKAEGLFDDLKQKMSGLFGDKK